MYKINAPAPHAANLAGNFNASPAAAARSPLGPGMPLSPLWTYTLVSAAFGFCLVAVPGILYFASQFLFSKGNIELALKNIGSMFSLLVLLCGFSLVFGTASGLMVGLPIELITKKKPVSPILTAALGGALWGFLTSFMLLIVPIAISIILVITIGAALPMILAIIVAVPFSSIYFTLTMACCRLVAKRRALKLFQVFFIALGTALIYCGVLPFIFLLYVLITTFLK